jgi:hypothetical protein
LQRNYRHYEDEATHLAWKIFSRKNLPGRHLLGGDLYGGNLLERYFPASEPMFSGLMPSEQMFFEQFFVGQIIVSAGKFIPRKRLSVKCPLGKYNCGKIYHGKIYLQANVFTPKKIICCPNGKFGL